MWLLLACTPDPKPLPADIDVASPVDSHVDSGVDSAGDAHVDSGVDSGADSGVDSGAGPEDSGDGEIVEPWRSALYPEGWSPDWSDGEGRFLHDFSYAGYRAGEAEPDDPVTAEIFDVVDHGADPSGEGDSTEAIQAAIDAAELSGGLVWFPAGEYRVDGRLWVKASGVVLRGEGAELSRIYFTQGEGMAYKAHLSFTGSLVEGEDLPLLEDGERRGQGLRLAAGHGLAPGDEVHLGWTISPEWTEDHGMTGIWTEFSGLWRPFFRRTVLSVTEEQGGTAWIGLDVPLRYPALTRDGASLRRVEGYISEVGIEDLGLSNVNDWETAWSEVQAQLLLLEGVKDGWVRRVASYESPWSSDDRGRHVMSGGIEVRASRRVSVLDSQMERPQHRGDGGSGYLFQISTSNEVLTRDCVAIEGRHNFIQNWDFGCSGLVWLRTTSIGGRSYLDESESIGYDSYSEFHHSLAMACLIDQSVAEDGWQGVNRQSQSSGAGHTATETVFWNTSGGGYLRSLQFGHGYVIGTSDMELHLDPEEPDWNNSGEGTLPVDWLEGEERGGSLEPSSLYEDQLRRRLGG